MSTTHALSAAPERRRSPRSRRWALAALDLSRSATHWQMWALLGVSDIRLRYKRSRIGQFWITLSMAFFVAGIGGVYGGLFHQDMRTYVPYLAVNMTVWGLIQSIIGESCQAFIEAAGYLRQEAMPRTTFVLRVMLRNLIAFGHNIVIIPAVFVIFGRGIGASALLAPLGLAVALWTTFMAGLSLAMLCTRFRDMPQVIGNLMQLAFFLTPVMWHVEQLGANAWMIETLNPFSALLRVVSEPILGSVPSAQTYATACATAAIMTAITLPCFARYRARIVYWL